MRGRVFATLTSFQHSNAVDDTRVARDWVASVVDQMLTRVPNDPLLSQVDNSNETPRGVAVGIELIRSGVRSRLTQPSSLTFPGIQPTSCWVHGLLCHKWPQHTNTGDPSLLDGPFLDEELWVGADDMRVMRGGSQVRRRTGRGCGWRCEGGGGPLRGGASELSNASVLVYGSHKLEKGYKEGYTPFDLAIP